MKDYTEFMGLTEKIKSTGVCYIGGGVPKDFIQLLAVTPDLMYKEREIPGREADVKRVKDGKKTETYYPHKYAVQITTDSPQWADFQAVHSRKLQAGEKKPLMLQRRNVLQMPQSHCL